MAASVRVRWMTASALCEVLAPALLDGLAHARQGVLAQQLQDPHEPAGAAQAAVVSFQRGAEVGEARGELPVAEDRRMVQRPGLRPSVAR